MSNKSPKSTAGFDLIFDYGQSLAAATTTDITYTKPNGVTGTWVASISGNTIEYTILSSDLDVEGNWSYQSLVVTPSWRQPSEVYNFEVTDLLE